MKTKLLVALIAIASLASTSQAAGPWPADVKGHVPVKPGEHPRLLFRRSDLPALRTRAKTPEGQAILKRLKITLNGSDGASMPANLGMKGKASKDGTGEFAKDPAGKTFTISHVAGYGFLYQITGEKKYADLGRKAMALMAIAGDPGIDQSKIDKLLKESEKSMIRNVTEGFDDGGYFSIGYAAVLPSQRAGIWGFYHKYIKDWDDKNGTPWDTISPYPHHSILAFVNTPFDLKPTDPAGSIPRCVRDSRHEFYGFRNRWKDENDIVITQLVKKSPARFRHGPDRSMLIRHHGKKTSWGSIPSKATIWIPGADGSAIIGSDKGCVAIDFSGASGADGMLVMTGAGAPDDGAVSAGGRKFSIKFLTTAAAPTPKVEGDKIVIGTQTVSYKDGKIVLGKMVGLFNP